MGGYIDAWSKVGAYLTRQLSQLLQLYSNSLEGN
jgi:hypothetical protein